MGHKKKNPHAVALGRQGGLAKSERKARAARRNAIISVYKRKVLLGESLTKELLDTANRLVYAAK